MVPHNLNFGGCYRNLTVFLTKGCLFCLELAAWVL